MLKYSGNLAKHILDIFEYYETLSPSTIEIERFFKLIKDLGLKKMTNLKLERKEKRVRTR
jgi:hypothetical protein